VNTLLTTYLRQEDTCLTAWPCPELARPVIQYFERMRRADQARYKNKFISTQIDSKRFNYQIAASIMLVIEDSKKKQLHSGETTGGIQGGTRTATGLPVLEFQQIIVSRVS
jgi:hypothetical protein